MTDERAEENIELQNIVRLGIIETLNLFVEHPGMFSTEGDCVAHLFRIIGSKEYGGMRLVDAHPETGACAIRCEWKQLNSIESIDVMIIDAGNFQIRNARTKKEGGFGSAPAHVIIEVKGPQVIISEVKDDINKVSRLLGYASTSVLANKGFVVLFAGDNINHNWEDISNYAEDRGVEFLYKITTGFQ